LFLLALCHTIIIERTDGQITYNASSPDELALINFAKFCGVQFMGNNEENIMEVKFREQMYRY
jgi:phospholipid-transporting ATPase